MFQNEHFVQMKKNAHSTPCHTIPRFRLSLLFWQKPITAYLTKNKNKNRK